MKKYRVLSEGTFQAKDPSFSGGPTIYSKSKGDEMDYCVIAFSPEDKEFQVICGKSEDEWMSGGDYQNADSLENALEVATGKGYNFDTSDIIELKDYVKSLGEMVVVPDPEGSLDKSSGAADVKVHQKPELDGNGGEITEAEEDVERTQAIFQIGDFIKMGLEGSALTAERLAKTLELRGHVGVDFEDPYAALNVLTDEDLTEVYNFAMTNGMPSVGMAPIATEPAATAAPEVTS